MANAREERRKNRISVLHASLNRALREKGSGNYNKLIGMAMIEFGASRRTSIEYLEAILSTRDDLKVNTNGEIIVTDPEILTQQEKEVLDAT